MQPKKMGRPATGQGTPVQVRIQEGDLAALDAFIARQTEPKPGRPEMIRRVLVERLVQEGDLPKHRGAGKDEGLRPEDLNAENDG